MSGANDTGDFIGIMANSLCQGQNIMTILSAYWRTASVISKNTADFICILAQSRSKFTGDFIGILANSHSQEQTILVILSAYCRNNLSRMKNILVILENSLSQERFISCRPVLLTNYASDGQLIPASGNTHEVWK